MLSRPAIAERLPDLPRWVEVRALLMAEQCEIFGLKAAPDLSVAVRDPDTDEVFVIGRPDAAAVRAAIEHPPRGATVIAPAAEGPWLADMLAGWVRSRAVLHLLPSWERLPAPSDGTAGLLDPETLERLPLPPDLRDELIDAAGRSPIAAAFAGDQPVSFCYAGAITETLWDISIDTLPEHRRCGHARRCTAHMIWHMAARGKQPVWCALDENAASWNLARKLGFKPVDELAVFQRPEGR